MSTVSSGQGGAVLCLPFYFCSYIFTECSTIGMQQVCTLKKDYTNAILHEDHRMDNDKYLGNKCGICFVFLPFKN